MDNATEINRAYYDRLTAGRESYWKLMPAPRMRIERVVEAIRAAKPAVRHLCDFGCGNGDLLAALAHRFPNAKLYGIDLAAEQIRANAASKCFTIDCAHFCNRFRKESFAPSAKPMSARKPDLRAC